MSVSVRHLVGKEDELAALVDLLGVPEGSYAAAVIVGEAGIGKTLSSAVAEEAASEEVVGEVCRRAGIGPARIVPAVE